MLLDFIDLKTALVIAHVFGAVIGAGGAYASDLMFLTSVRDEKITKTEIKFLKLGSAMVWTGIILLVTSGVGIFTLDIEKYLVSSKFLAKMSIVSVIILNGIFFHYFHIPRIMRHTGEHLPSSDEFMRKRPILIASGAVSLTSWTWALVLGILMSIPYSYVEIMFVYAGTLILAMIFALILEGIIMPHRHQR